MSALGAALVLALAVALRLAVGHRSRSMALRRLRSAPTRIGAGQTSTRWRASRGRGDIDVASAARAMARSVRGGDSATQAIESATTDAGEGCSPALHRAAERARAVGLVAACEEWRRADPRRGVRLLTATLQTAASSGAPVARALDSAADTIEARAAVEREAWAQAATARASAAVLVVGPIAFSGFAVLADSASLRFLTRTPVGLFCLVTAVALDAAGAFWMARITAAGSS